MTSPPSTQRPLGMRLAPPAKPGGVEPRAVEPGAVEPGGAERVDLRLSPIEAFDRWPASTPLAAIWADSAGKPWSRWVLIAQPTGETAPVTEAFAGAPWQGVACPGAAHNEPHIEGKNGCRPEDHPPFCGGWIGSLGYELGRRIEPAARGPSPASDAGHDRPDPPGGDGVMLRCDSGWVYDTWSGQWWRFGDPPDLTDERTSARSLSRADGFALGAMVSTVGQGAYCRGVSRVVEYIRAGDVFQANLAHSLRGLFRGSARRLFTRWAASAVPHHGAYLELPAGGTGGAIPPRAIVSMSPELFLDFDPATRRVVTRPMKGTSSARLDPALLIDSAKDRAELNMIVDLMRNDLGRVCAFGSVRVDEARVIERHGGESADPPDGAGGVHQGVATVSGRLATGLGLGDLFRATFAPGSVTGAPKIRAMQIIEELEPAQRGPYCGAIGFVSDTGHVRFNVAIRTAVIAENTTDCSEKPEGGVHDTSATTAHTFADATLTYGVGAGIVADSIPEKEWDETITKAGILRTVAASVERS